MAARRMGRIFPHSLVGFFLVGFCIGTLTNGSQMRIHLAALRLVFGIFLRISRVPRLRTVLIDCCDMMRAFGKVNIMYALVRGYMVYK